MAVYRFRVTFEDYDEVSRDIEIKSSQTFDDFNHAIHAYIGFDASKSASFYMSNDFWKKGKEISNRDLKTEEKEKVSDMSTARLFDFIADPHQKIYYVFDPVVQWAFRIELIKILVNEESGISYPQCIKSVGDAPKQYGPVITEIVPEPEDFVEPAEEDEADEGMGIETGIDEDEIPVGIDPIADDGEGASEDEEMIDHKADDDDDV